MYLLALHTSVFPRNVPVTSKFIRNLPTEAEKSPEVFHEHARRKIRRESGEVEERGRRGLA
ncbi:hypothetical protein WN48_10945 [Eufriesea mexicana]|uniref:Uncharacterized protein n=1 Tax=Eufriesea mexicana TaxID=516756 RepID=A0A310SDH3_9HYME|nr:hypothetical protein WN48_10945 [Eufriesea mexicana]